MDAWLIAVIAICVAGFLVFVIQRVVQAHRHQAAAGREELVGRTAEVETTPLGSRVISTSAVLPTSSSLPAAAWWRWAWTTR